MDTVNGHCKCTVWKILGKAENLADIKVRELAGNDTMTTIALMREKDRYLIFKKVNILSQDIGQYLGRKGRRASTK